MTSFVPGSDGRSTVSLLDVEISSWTTKHEQILLLRAFTLAVRGGRFSDMHCDTLAEGTVRGTTSNMVKTFWSLERQNPSKDADKEFSILLSTQFLTFQNEDPKENQQKALPFSVLNELAKMSGYIYQQNQPADHYWCSLLCLWILWILENSKNGTEMHWTSVLMEPLLFQRRVLHAIAI